MLRPFNCLNRNPCQSGTDRIHILNKRNKCLPVCNDTDPPSPTHGIVDYIPSIPCTVINNNRQILFKSSWIVPQDCGPCEGGGGDGGGGNIPFFASLTTTDAVPTVVFSTTVELDRLQTVHGKIQARGDTNSISASFSATAANIRGKCALVGEPVITYSTTTEGTDIDVTLLGCSMNIVVTGLATEDLRWVTIYYVINSTAP